MPLVHISMAAGRSAEQKTALLEAVTAAVHESIGAPIASIRVWITEFDPAHYMAGGVLLDERDGGTGA
jgi:4-oxalocrotonate tautomerase